MKQKAMKQYHVILFCMLVMGTGTTAQTIPSGDSMDSLLTPDGLYHDIFYYKPAGYDSLNSPILWTIHGDGWTGDFMRDGLKFIADSRNALIVSPTMAGGYHFGFSVTTALSVIDTSLPGDAFWYPIIFKEIYKHVLAREMRDSISVYLTGWSRGAQCVTRYMLLRQALADSIPIRMAVSLSPCSYTFCTDTLQGTQMRYPFGLNGRLFGSFGVEFICDEHVKSYYNENYAVIIGTADLGCGCVWVDECAQGNNRYERAQNFYAFSDSDAVNRGTALKWQYAEIPGIGHDWQAMYGAKADTADTSTIAETLLFDSPYYPPTVFPPTADFTWSFADSADSICNTVKFNARCAYNRFPNNVLWDLGDGGNSSEFEPLHVYSDSGTYAVTLTITNSVGNDILIQNVTLDNSSPVQPDFYADTTIVNLPDATVQFYNSSINAVSYLWDFGDGNTSTSVNPLYTYTTADTFTVKLTATSAAGCENTLIKKDYIIVQSTSGVSEVVNYSSFVFNVSPNPFSEKTRIEFALPEEAEVNIELYNYTGQIVKRIFSGKTAANKKNEIFLNGKDMNNGIYFLKLQTEKEIRVIKLVLLQ